MTKKKMKLICHFHMAISKGILLWVYDNHGPDGCGFKRPFPKREDIVNDERLFFTLGRCNNTEKDGSCKGHKKPVKQK